MTNIINSFNQDCLFSISSLVDKRLFLVFQKHYFKAPRNTHYVSVLIHNVIHGNLKHLSIWNIRQFETPANLKLKKIETYFWLLTIPQHTFWK